MNIIRYKDGRVFINADVPNDWGITIAIKKVDRGLAPYGVYLLLEEENQTIVDCMNMIKETLEEAANRVGGDAIEQD